MADTLNITTNVIESSGVTANVADGISITTTVNESTSVTANVTTGGKGDKGDTGDTGAGVAAGGTANQALTKINSTDYNTQWSTVDKTFVGLGNVDNTSDASKPISTATQTALDGKSATSHTHALAAGATDVTASAAELNILDGATLTTTELNYVDGVTSAIQTQLNTKAASSHTHTESDITDLGTYLEDITGENLTDLADVTITTPSNGQVLKYNGSAWINDTDASGGTPAWGDITGTIADQTDLQAELDDKVSTASNVGTPPEPLNSASVFKQKTGDDLEFHKLSSDNTTGIVISNDGDSNTVVFGIEPSQLAPNISHNDIQDVGTNTHDQIDSHIANTSNPHSVTKSQLGLGNVDNTSDANKPVSTAQAAADALKVSKTGDTMTGDLTFDGSAGQRDLTLTSTGAGGYDGVNNEANTGAYYDSTSRINLQSYQPHFNSYGETIRNYLKDPRAKAMLTYLADWDTPHYATSDYTWTSIQAGAKTICWIGAHFLNNDDPNNFEANLQHGHFNIEVPDSAGALRTRLEIKLIDETTGKFGVETTSIRTNKAHFEFQIASGDEKFRLVGSTLRNKDIEFNQDVRGGNPCFTLRGGAATSGDFEVHRFSGSPRTDQGTPLKIERLTGLITLGNGTSGTVAQIVSTDGSTTSPLYLIQSANSGRRAIQIGVTGDSSNRLNIFADGKMEWGSGSATRDTNLYRSAADTLRTDDSFSVGGSITVTGTVDGRDVSVDGTKLDGIEAAADVTDTANVTAAGALMDSEVTSLSGIKTLTVPDSTTISTFGASLVDDTSASNARTTLGLGTIATLAAPSGTVVGTSDTQTLTNKRVTPRVGTTTSSATPTINTDNVDYYSLTAQTADITSFTTNLSGTPTDGQKLWISITGTAARAITWGASFEASTVALPTTTVTTNRLDVGFVWNAATSKWRCVAVA